MNGASWGSVLALIEDQAVHPADAIDILNEWRRAHSPEEALAAILNGALTPHEAR